MPKEMAAIVFTLCCEIILAILGWVVKKMPVPLAIVLMVLASTGAIWGFVSLIRGHKKEATAIQAKPAQIEPAIIKNTEINTVVKDADKAIGLEINRPTQVDNLKVSVTASNVHDVIGVRTINQTPTNLLMSCSNCGQPLPVNYFGDARPQSAQCRRCGAWSNVPKFRE